MLEALLIQHGSPTLARLKAASLMPVPDSGRFDGEFEALRNILIPKGLCPVILRRSQGSVLLYVYRERDLKNILKREDTQCFLSGCGYTDFSTDAALAFLTERIAKTEDGGFPHEIGIFLGYPLADVVAFIVNRGKNCLCCGCWKAYTDACGAMKTFARYAKCKEVYMRMFAAGVPMKRLVVRS